MRRTRTVDKDDPECRFFSEKRHPNRQNKKVFTLTMNIIKMEETLKAIKEGIFPSKDLSRTFLITPKKNDETWLRIIFDLEHPMENLESPKSKILKIMYINKKGKEKPKLIYLDSEVTGIGWQYVFNVHDIDEAEYLLPFIQRFFLSEEIRVFRPEYRDPNSNMWRSLDFEQMI